ncbi:MAG: hypothetical protein WAM82_33055 [Thermoanaerobaculia bacterium]
MRNYVRTLFSVAEGMESAACFFLKAAAERGEVTLPLGSPETDSGSLPDRLIATFNLYSELFGTGYRLPQSGKQWEGFLVAHVARNRLTHPKTAEDLGVSIQEYIQCLEGNRWLTYVYDSLRLDTDKMLRFAVQAGSIT